MELLLWFCTVIVISLSKIFPPHPVHISTDLQMNFPPELFLHIIDQIDHPRDLLSLALANRLFSATIIPDHMDYRQIWCEVDEHKVWDHLLEQRSRCKAVRTLTVDNPERRYIPRPCGQQTNGTPNVPPRRLLSQQKFYEALSRMSNLKTLKCALSNEEITTNVSNAIARAGCALDELEVEVGRPQYQETSKKPFKLEVSTDESLFICCCDYGLFPFLKRFVGFTYF